MKLSDKLGCLVRIAAAFCTAQAAGIVLMYLLDGLADGYWYNILLNAICTLGTNAAAFVLICGRGKLPKSHNYTVWELPAFFFGGVFLACLAGYLAKLLPVNNTAALPQGNDLILYAAYTLILSPIAEEIAFRGAALPYLRSAFDFYGAAFISAVLFAAYHMSLLQLPYTFVVGFCLAIVAQRSGSIIPCIILHALNNLLTLGAALSHTLAAITDFALPILGAAGIIFIIVTRRYLPNTND